MWKLKPPTQARFSRFQKDPSTTLHDDREKTSPHKKPSTSSPAESKTEATGQQLQSIDRWTLLIATTRRSYEGRARDKGCEGVRADLWHSFAWHAWPFVPRPAALGNEGATGWQQLAILHRSLARWPSNCPEVRRSTADIIIDDGFMKPWITGARKSNKERNRDVFDDKCNVRM